MENPASWGPVEKTIDEALFKWQEAYDSGHVGWSKVMMIADELRKAGLVTDDLEKKQGGAWFEGWNAAREVVEFEGLKVWNHTVTDPMYICPYPLPDTI